MAKLLTEYGSERSDANRWWRSGLTASGMTVPVTATLSTSSERPSFSLSSSTSISRLSALETYTIVRACAAMALEVKTATLTAATVQARENLRGLDIIRSAAPIMAIRHRQDRDFRW